MGTGTEIRAAGCKRKNEAEHLKHVLAENKHIQEELDAVDLAQDTMTNLSTTIRDSFGLYLNKTASELIEGITGGIYRSMSIDQDLNIFMNTPTRLVPIEQVSSGTMDQIYLAVRLAAAKLVIGDKGNMPLIFDDSFALYDDDRLKTALKWLSKSLGQAVYYLYLPSEGGRDIKKRKVLHIRSYRSKPYMTTKSPCLCTTYRHGDLSSL